MSRYTGPTTRLNRRFSMAIFPGDKAYKRKPYLPGVHGPRLRRKISNYALALNEKQKLRFMYGLTEKQFYLTFMRAKRERGVTGIIFLRLLEMRLDNVVYRLGISRTRASARQFVTHGHIKVNNIKVDIPSYIVSPGDEIEVRKRTSSQELANSCIEEMHNYVPPSWLSINRENLHGQVKSPAEDSEIEQVINIQLIVEYYSR